MLLKNKLNKVKSFLKSDNVLAKLEERYCYSKDALNQPVDYKIADLVVFVETIEEVQKVLKYANEHSIPVVSRGAGTNMVGACVTTNGGIVLNFSKMNKILEVDSVNMTAKVQPGVILGDLKKTVEAKKLFFPPDPSNYKVSTIGGAIAQSSGGAMSLKYGTTKDYVLSLKVVTADGKLMTVGADTQKDAVGYHLGQLMVGSEGTLGVIVEAVLKLIPKPSFKCAISSYFDTIESAVMATNTILSSQIFPATIDFMDNNSIKTAEEYSKIGLNISKECLLIIEIDSYGDDLEYQVNVVQNILNKYSSESIVAYDSMQIEKIWDARRISYAATTRLAPDVISDDIIVPRDSLLQMIKGCNEICSKYNLNLCLVGHLGDGNLHPQIALNLEDDNEFKDYITAKSQIYDLTISLGGTISAEHGVGVEKLKYLPNTIDNNALEYMKMIKKVFDPKGILNPGKIFE